jgi:tripartite-type tricarboxylate transporter receptor subunit TctC
VLAALLSVACGAWAQSSDKSIRLIVPFAVGGPTDVLARIVAPRLAEALRQPVIVENKVGATGSIGAELVARAPADGTAILLGTSSIMAANPALQPRLAFDPIADFAPVSLIATIESVLVVHPSVPVGSVREFIAYAKANPGKLTYASSGIGSTYHLSAELFRTHTGVELTHVPYKGAAPAAQDLLAGHVQLMFDNLSSAIPNIRAGKVRALGIASLQRHADLKDVPTIAEQGVPDYQSNLWIALFLPARTPAAIVDRYHTEVTRILGTPEVRDHIARLGMEPQSSTPQQLDTLLRADTAKWAKVVRDAGIRPQQ